MDEDVELRVRAARQTFGDALPDGALTDEELRMYERLYGPASQLHEYSHDAEGKAGSIKGETTLLAEGEDGVVEEYTVARSEAADGEAEKQRGGGTETAEDIMTGLSQDAKEAFERYLEVLEREEAGEPLDPRDEGVLADEKNRDIFARIASAETLADDAFVEEDDLDNNAEEQEESEDDDADFEDDVWPGDERRLRTHPLTALGLFCTSPSTVELPTKAFVEPVAQMLSSSSTAQLRDVAQRVFNGVGLPDSPSTPRRSRTMKQVPIPLTAGQRNMTDMESLVFLAAVMPQVYTSVLSVMTEVRKKLGKEWLRGLIEKEGGPVILDVGAGGAGVVAFREVLKAEWEALKAEEARSSDSADAKEERRHRRLPHGKATVLTGSDKLRQRASRLLDDTAFIPRLPEAIKDGDAPNRKTYDVIIATHTLWPMEKEYLRKAQVDTYWSLLNPNGGVLVLVEKGVPRGFEVIGGARERLLKRHISSPGSSTREVRLEGQSQTTITGEAFESAEAEQSINPLSNGRFTKKETGMIIAPCTNHAACPMYVASGVSLGRKTWCHFPQRYVRPPFLQHLLGAKSRNDDKVEFSYVAAWRGKDLRQEQRQIPVEDERVIGTFDIPAQGQRALDRAFRGAEAATVIRDASGSGSSSYYAATNEPFDALSPAPTYPHPLQLPRLVLPPLKRKKMVIMDVCTPAATLDRWIVTKGFSRQAYRDARKASWGDVWALGAKSRQRMRVNFGKRWQRMTEMAKAANEDVDGLPGGLVAEDEEEGQGGEMEKGGAAGFGDGGDDDDDAVDWGAVSRQAEKSEKRLKERRRREKRKGVKERRRKISVSEM